MPISPDFESKLVKDWKINFLQCYPNGYLKYTDLCNILQLTAAKHAELGGLSFNDMQEFHQAWVLSRIRIEINRLPKWKDKITVKTWINSLENSRSIRCIELFQGEEKLVGCETFWVVMNTNTRRPENLGLAHEHFIKYPERATLESFSKIDIQHDFKKITEQTVKLSDLDIVNHANSVKYLEWCLNYIDVEAVFFQKIKTIEMNYLKELSLNDAFEISKKTEDNKLIYKVHNSEKTNFALQLELK
ncbi:acyl-[acyl-carrier-protein] thioesterase [Flavobacterium capsici]|uniref:Thioesterase n=1 Tax=Flavobacterium capsici TaxID=3075618 RepID=A0AA96F3Z6_9FLAO|nr:MULTISPECIES: acyl-ACP thioesterase domain-containing protein [unclassified Flavobacterium]WNM18301.1 thioesterase [Flavobacterium sp. PMR2A8]WNM22352.1 thioesterase [Flavobacterium sp. PMTSA4]